MRSVHWLRAVAVLATVISGLLLGGGVPAFAGGGTTIGPVQINPVGHPHLCWQATGNGAPILLETCDSALQNQQWSLTPDGVVMNGIGYCLEALPGHPAGVPLYIDFADQCGGSRGQIWQYNGTNGHLSSAGTCAGLSGRIAAGTTVVRRSCSRGPGWSIGYSAVTLHGGSGTGRAGGSFGTSVTVTDAASAQTAYRVTVEFGRLTGLDYAGLHGTGAASAWRCDSTLLTCTGTLPVGASGLIYLSGHLPATARPGQAYSLTARAVVAGTSQLHSGPIKAVPATVTVHAAPPAPSAWSGSSGLPLLAVAVAVFLLCGGLLTGFTLRRRPAGTRARPAATPAYQGHRRRVSR
jgi:hypothetical protein